MIVNGIKVKLKQVGELTCEGCVFYDNHNCTVNKPRCSLNSIYVKSDE